MRRVCLQIGLLLVWAGIASGAPMTVPQIVFGGLKATLQGANLDGSSPEVIVDDIGWIEGIAIDGENQTIYWSQIFNDRITRLDLNSSTLDVIYSGSGGTNIRAVAVDPIHGYLFWAENGRGIVRSSLDGTNQLDLIPGVADAFGIELDVAAGTIYWTETYAGAIRRAHLDGTNVENLITGLVEPFDIALDRVHRQIYWTDTSAGTVSRAALDGIGVATIITGLAGPQGIDFDATGGRIYWAAFGAGKLQSANADGSNVTDLLAGLSEVRAVQLVPEPSTFALLSLGLLWLARRPTRRCS